MQRFWLFPLFAALFLLSCDEEPGLPTSDVSDVRLTTLSMSPSSILFVSGDGVKDTLIQVGITLQVASGTLTSPPTLIVTDTESDEIVFEGPMSQPTSHTLSIETTTTSVAEYAVSVIAIEDGQPVSNKLLGRLRVNGFSTGRPTLLFEQTPSTVQIPSSGSQIFDLKTKVSHPNGNSLIQTVNVIIRGQNGAALSGSPFQLFDNGNTTENGDAAAGDSLYTRRFVISASNNPDTYTLRYYAIDRFGASSDTLTATMRFVP